MPNKIISIDASMIGKELVVDLNKKNRNLYKSTINDCLDVAEIIEYCDKEKIDYSFGLDLFNPIINVSFNYPETKFYIYKKQNDIYFILNGINAYDLDFENFDNGIYKDEKGNVIAVKPDSLKEEIDVEGLEFDNKGRCVIKEYLDQRGLRKELYENGFKVRYISSDKEPIEIKYKRYKRSASAAKQGQCYFIREDLYDHMMKWTTLGDRLKPKEDKKILNQKASWEAYIALSLSGIEKNINIPLDNILIVKDIESTFNDTCINIIKNKDNSLEAKEENIKIRNKIWDGEGLLDESIFKDNGYENYGMLLLRNRFLKSCVFNTNLQKWFKDNNITDVNQLNGVTSARKIEDIKLVITESSLKLLKFADDAINQEKMNDLVSRIWTDIADSKFGVVKHDKKTKFFNGKKVQTTYQLLNTLALSEDDIEKLFEPAKDYYEKISSDPACLRYYLNMRLDDNDSHDEEDSSYVDESDNDMNFASFKEIVSFELLKYSDKVMKTKICSELLTDIRDSMNKRLKASKVLVDGTYATLFSNGYELLQFIIYKGERDKFLGNVKKTLKPGEIMCSHFAYNKELLCARNPHITMGNLYIVKNVKNDDIKKYFNLSSTIVCVNAINENLMQRLNGADFDSDTMLITDEKILLAAAKKNYARFKVPTFDMKTDDTNYDLAELDYNTSNNIVGKIVNESQTLNSIYWDIYNKDPNDPKLTELYKEICKLSILANIEIDKAKKNYNINSEEELERIQERIKELGFNPTKPNFLKKGKTDYATSCCYVQKHAEIKAKVKGAGKNLRIVQLLNCKNYDTNFNDGSPEMNIIKRINDINKESGFGKKEDANQNNKSILDNMYDDIKDDLIKVFKNNKIKNLFAKIEKEYQSSDRKNKNNEAPKTLYLLYFIYKLDKFKELFNKEKVTTLKMSKDGDIKMYGYNFKKEKK